MVVVYRPWLLAQALLRLTLDFTIVKPEQIFVWSGDNSVSSVAQENELALVTCETHHDRLALRLNTILVVTPPSRRLLERCLSGRQCKYRHERTLETPTQYASMD